MASGFLCGFPGTHRFFYFCPAFWKMCIGFPQEIFSVGKSLNVMSSALSFYMVLIVPQPFSCCLMQNWYLCSMPFPARHWTQPGKVIFKWHWESRVPSTYLSSSHECLWNFFANQSSYFLVSSPVRREPAAQSSQGIHISVHSPRFYSQKIFRPL